MPQQVKRVALFGGSFNPPHEGHREIVKRVARRKSIDEVWILPVWRHPFGKKLAPFENRVKSCRTFFKKIKVKTFEKRRGATGYTIDLLRFLKRRFPTLRFWWVMGSDTWRQRRHWKDFPEITRICRLIVFPRGRGSPIPAISSSELRAKRH